MEDKCVASKQYQKWWEENKEHILEQDRLNHELDYKISVINNLDDVELNQD